jgi:hypothetical protein
MEIGVEHVGTIAPSTWLGASNAHRVDNHSSLHVTLLSGLGLE